MMPDLLKNSAIHRHNVIVRPNTAQGVEHIQLDDLAAGPLERVKDASFLCLQTSPGNFQAWVAVRDACDPDFARRLKKGTGADPNASGATRVSGSFNFKKKYAPHYPFVELAHLAPRRIVSKDDLERLGLVAPKEEASWQQRVSRSSPHRDQTKWPSYERCVERAPANHADTGPDISRADFTWCLLALDWNKSRSIEEVADRLVLLSDKAHENGVRYALRTAQSAAAAVERRRGQVAKK
jgi:hypothetical protein